MNKIGQSGLYMMLILFIIGLIWILGLAPWISEVGSTSVEENNLQGLNAFFYSNLNLVIGFFYIMALVAVGKYGFG